MPIAFTKMIKRLRGIRSLYWGLRNAADRAVDRYLGIDTFTSPVPAITGMGQHADGNDYEGVYYELLFKSVRFLKPTAEDVVFDIGCGTGRVLCVYARSEAKACVGIEIIDALARKAEDNLRTLRGKRAPVSIQVTDATVADYDEGTIYCFFNPFGAATLGAVLARIQESIAANPRRVRIAYFFPLQEHTLRSAGFRLIGRSRMFLSGVGASYWESEG